jgi:hypothetical protein
VVLSHEAHLSKYEAVNQSATSQPVQAILIERYQPNGQLSFVLPGWPRLDDLGRVRLTAAGW